MKCAICGLNLYSIDTNAENFSSKILSHYACPANDYSIITYYNGNILETFDMLLNVEEDNNIFLKVQNHTEYIKNRRSQYKNQYAVLLVDDWELVRIKHLMPIGSTSYKCDCNICNE